MTKWQRVFLVLAGGAVLVGLALVAVLFALRSRIQAGIIAVGSAYNGATSDTEANYRSGGPVNPLIDDLLGGSATWSNTYGLEEGAVKAAAAQAQTKAQDTAIANDFSSLVSDIEHIF